MTNRTNIFFLFFFWGLGFVIGQSNLSDSLKSAIQSEKEIAKKVNLMYLLGDTYDYRDSAMHYFNAARALSQKHGYLKGEVNYSSYVIPILNEKGKFREALELTLEALELAKRINDPYYLATAYINLGKEWRAVGDLEMASDNYLMAKKIADSIADKTSQRTINNNLFALFLDMKEYEKGKPYGFEALRLAEESGDELKTLSPLYNLSNLFYYQKNYTEALKYIEKFEKAVAHSGDDYDQTDALLAKGNIMGEINVEEGIRLISHALADAKKYGFQETEAYAYLYLGQLYMKNRKYREAIANLNNGIPIAKELGIRYELANFHKNMAEAYELLGDYKNAMNHVRANEVLKEEIQIEENKNRMIALEAKYRFEQKETEIRTLNAEKQAQTLKIRQKNVLNFALACLLMIVGMIGVLVYKNHKNKQKLQEERIRKLETEKQLSATRALLQGQEDERSRMAKELHDGLGGLLSGVKLNLNNMQKKLIITEEEGAAFEKSIHLLDESISELRRVAHNLMPESILKFGLDGAIREFLQSMESENLSIFYQSYHINESLGKQLDISVYRIIQELVNNSIKHSGASEILIQIRKDDRLLIIEVEDNGCGFDVLQVDHGAGMGLTGIRSRTVYHKGNIEIHSQKDEGTAVSIEIPL